MDIISATVLPCAVGAGVSPLWGDLNDLETGSLRSDQSAVVQDLNAFRSQIKTPQAHYDRLHEDARGVVITWHKQAVKGRWKKLQPGDENIQKVLEGFEYGEDRYISVNEFHNWRLVSQLKTLRACFVDIDGCVDIDHVLSCVESCGLPSPTLIVFSGRGVHLYWEIDPVPAKALGTWQRIQNDIGKRLHKAGLPVDLGAKDCTRVLRCAGSINSKNGAEVYGRVVHEWRWDLHTLADEVLGSRADQAGVTVDKKAAAALIKDLKRDAVVALNVKKTRADGLQLDLSREQAAIEFQHKLKEGLALDIDKEEAAVRSYRAWQLKKGLTPALNPDGSKKTRKGSIYEWWGHVYRDLIAIGDELEGIPEHYRDKYLFLYCVALSWFADAGSLEAEVKAVAKKHCPHIKMTDLMKTVTPNVKRALMYQDGKKIEWDGQKRDPRYWYKRETIFGILSPIIKPDLYPSLRAILPEEIIRERKQVTEDARWGDKNTGQGVKVSNLEKAAQAQSMRAEGMTQGQIAAELGVSQRTISSWLKLV